jgi:flagellar assembly protein FliH
VLQLACDIARQVVRQELRSNPQALLPVVREALDMLSAESARHGAPESPGLGAPAGAAAAAHPQPKIEWLADASVKPGDCLVESAGAKWTAAWSALARAVAALGWCLPGTTEHLPMANDTDMPVADQLQRFLQLGRERLCSHCRCTATAPSPA